MYPVRLISRADLAQAAAELGVGVDVVKTVAAVEARNSGFLKGTDLPAILFEGHHFHRYTHGRFDASHPHLSHKSWTAAHYRGGRGEYDRLLEAVDINGGDPDAALLSTSWGMFQIMGFNHQRAGYDDVRAFVNAMAMGEDAHLRAFARFVLSDGGGLAQRLRDRDWTEFARAYNGAGFAKNQYDAKLAKEFAEARLKLQEEVAGGELALERAEAAALQTALNAQLGAGLTVDGWVGKNTLAAIRQFEAREGLPQTGRITADLCRRLGIDMAEYLRAAA
jgi:hypothetical protein